MLQALRKQLESALTFLKIILICGFILVGAQAKAASCQDILSLSVPLVPQSFDNTCGAACFESMFRYWKGWSPGELVFAKALSTFTGRHTKNRNIKLLAIQNGLFASQRHAAKVINLWTYLNHGETVLVSFISGGKQHLSLIKGLGESHITLMDPWVARSGIYNQLPLESFVEAWKTVGSTVVRVNGFPISPF